MSKMIKKYIAIAVILAFIGGIWIGCELSSGFKMVVIILLGIIGTIIGITIVALILTWAVNTLFDTKY